MESVMLVFNLSYIQEEQQLKLWIIEKLNMKNDSWIKIEEKLLKSKEKDFFVL